jgi:isocitrate/isopropylmalate dehydrogenase
MPPTDAYTLAVLHGDGIGPEIVPSTVAVMRAAAERHDVRLVDETLPVGLSAFERSGTTLPPETLERLPTFDGWVLGPVTHHTYDGPAMPNPSGELRRRFDLYANERPARSLPGVPALRDDVDLVIVRENTEGFYADRNVLDGSSEFRPTADVVVAMRVVTRDACRKVAEHAFRLAQARARGRGRPGRVTAVHKANVLKRSDGLFLEVVREVAGRHPDVVLDDVLVDAAALHLVRDPGRFDVIVTTNMFGDILSDEAAGLVGGLGLAPGLNAGRHHAMAQATHGSAPDIAGRGVANPTALMLSGAMLLRWLAETRDDPRLAAAADRLDSAVLAALRQPSARTPDLGGTATTAAFARAVAEHVHGDAPHPPDLEAA